MKTIVVTAYAINPYKGSEDATGWNWVCEMAKHNKIIAITRKNNEGDINKYRAENNYNKNLTFQYFDLPTWSRFWKIGEYTSLIYYYLWQLFIPVFIFKNKLEYDVLHHLNFHNDWTPSFLWLLNKPFIWGPIGHHPKIKKEYYCNSLPKKYYLSNKIRWWLKQMFWTFDPFLKITKHKADHIFIMHSSVAENLNISKDKCTVVPAIAAQNPIHNIIEKKNDNGFNIISIGRFIPLKGFDITLNAFAKFYFSLSLTEQNQTQLTIIGKGKLEKELHEIAENLGITNAVTFHKWMPRKELNNLYKNANCMFFPSHEGAGMVVMEALSYGLPILCFNNIGPGAFIDKFSGTKINYSNYEQSVSEFASELKFWFKNPKVLNEKSRAAKTRFLNNFQWHHKNEAVAIALNNIDFKYAKSSLYSSV